MGVRAGHSAAAARRIPPTGNAPPLHGPHERGDRGHARSRYRGTKRHCPRRSGRGMSTVLIERDGHLAHLILNRPEVFNAINNEMGEELRVACETLSADTEVWSVV